MQEMEGIKRFNVPLVEYSQFIFDYVPVLTDLAPKKLVQTVMLMENCGKGAEIVEKKEREMDR